LRGKNKIIESVEEKSSLVQNGELKKSYVIIEVEKEKVRDLKSLFTSIQKKNNL
jgi:hypothetical protein